MNSATIGILGGSGFIGSHLANALDSCGYHIRIFTRDREHARRCWTLPHAEVIEVDLNDSEKLAAAFTPCSTVINLIGILNERRDDGAQFQEVHAQLPQRAARACKAAGVEHFIQISALNADHHQTSFYLRSKHDGEALLRQESGRHFNVSVLRPSVVFGAQDSFANRFAELIRLSPGVLPIARADARFQPVFVGDVTQAILRLIEERTFRGRAYDIGGPEIVTLKEFIEYVASLMQRRVWVMSLGSGLSALQARVLEWVPGKPFSRDNLRSLQHDSVCSGENELMTLDIEPTPMREVLPRFLAGTNQRSRYYDYRVQARRD